MAWHPLHSHLPKPGIQDYHKILRNATWNFILLLLPFPKKKRVNFCHPRGQFKNVDIFKNISPNLNCGLWTIFVPEDIIIL